MRLKPVLLPAWSVLLALTVLAPLLAPGYVLHLDMVFVPHQSLLPWNLGIGAGLPRAVPQDALVALLAGPLPGQILQKSVLSAALVLAGIGAGRLAGPHLSWQLPAASIYLWSAYSASRLLMGHWALLLAFGLLPWVVLAARSARDSGRWLAVGLLCGFSALVPTGGIVAALVAVPLTVGFGTAVPRARRALFVGWVVLVNAPWWLAAVRSTSRAVSDPLGLQVFGARADGVGGVLLSVLGGGGVWNSQATLGSRTTWFAALGVVVLLTLAVVGWRSWWRDCRPEAVVLLVLGSAGVLWAWLSGVGAQARWAEELVSVVPGGGLLRDAQKWTLWWVLLVAICAPRGLTRLARSAEDTLRVFLAAALAVLPVAMLPDFAAGGFGRLAPATYPQAWNELREVVATSPLRGDVLSLPWAPFRRYSWNHSAVVLDPLPRYLTRTVVWNDSLPVTVGGRVVQVGGDDPRAAAVSKAISSGVRLPERLAALGVGWVVVQRDQPLASREVDLRGATRVWAQGDLELWRVRAEVVPWLAQDRLVVAVNIVVLVLMAGGSGLWLVSRQRQRRHATQA